MEAAPTVVFREQDRRTPAGRPRGRRGSYGAAKGLEELLEPSAWITLEALEKPHPAERRGIYGMSRLKVEGAADGSMEVRGVLRENGRVLPEKGLPA